MNDEFRVLICDDEEPRAKDYRKKIYAAAGSGVTVDVACPDDQASGVDLSLIRILEELNEREEGLCGGCPNSSIEAIKFDEYDVVVVDHDLRKLSQHNIISRPTAEDFLGKIRAYSDCFVTIVLNKNPDRDFDLSMRARSESHADISLNSRQLERTRLWCDVPPDGEFRPAYWPCLETYVRKRRRQVEKVFNSLDSAPLDILGIDAKRSEQLSNTAKGRLSLDGTPESFPSDCYTYFRHIVTSVPRKDRTELLNKAGEIVAVQKVIARVVASELSNWLHYDVLLPQDLLVDAPHLVERAPLLLEGDSGDIANWDLTVGYGDEITGIDRAGRWGQLIDQAVYDRAYWLPAPAVWFDTIERSVELQRELYKEPASAFSFCEDMSAFAEDECTEEFVTDFDNIWNRRRAKRFEQGVSYGPNSRFAM